MMNGDRPVDSNGVSRAEAAVLDALDEQAMVATLVRLVRTPSITGSDAESELQDELAGDLADLGLNVDLWKFDLDALTADPRYPGTEADRTEGYGLVAQSGDVAGAPSGPATGTADTDADRPALILQGHTDVVPTGDLDNWADRDPFSGRITGDLLHGRGTCDMKAGVAVNLAVARALIASGVRFRRTFAIHQVVSEEDGGLGAFATMLRGHTGDACVITEPTSGRLVTANAGALTFELSVPGRAAHGSMRLAGVSSIDAFLPVYAALRALEQERNRPGDVDPLFDGNPLPYAISVGRVRAGDWSSSVPDLLTAEGRMGVRLGEPEDHARAALEAAVADACADDPWLRDNPVQVTWPGGQFGSGRIAAGHPFIDQVNDAIGDVTGVRRQLAAAPYGSDLRLYTELGGIPTLHFGPGDVAYAHAPREQVSITETIACARALAVLAVRRLEPLDR